MNTVYLLMGGNLGNVKTTFKQAIGVIEQMVGAVITKSSLYQTAAWGMENQPAFLNQALEVSTNFSAHEVLEKILQIENQLGRVRQQKYGPRVIDIDILFYNNEIVDEADLKIPHPLLQHRNFALYPLNEIAPDWLHPVFQKNIQTLLKEVDDRLTVSKLD